MELYDGVPRELSALQKKRTLYQPELPPSLQGTSVRAVFGDTTTAVDMYSSSLIKEAFPLTHGQRLAHFLCEAEALPSLQLIRESSVIRVGVVFCGRQAPGGHNVIWGLHDAIRSHNPDSVLLGFVGGTEGLFAQKTIEITDKVLSAYKNQGGYDLLGRTLDQLRTTKQLMGTWATCEALKLDGLVIIGGVTSNNDAAHLAEFFSKIKCSTKVVGVPVTINGDLKNHFVETNVGFDTVCRVNSQLIGNICLDALSAEKYYYFIRLMGHKSSHIAVECALQTHPNMVFLGEEVETSRPTLQDIIIEISDGVQARAEQGKYHGVILIPEGLVESVPELNALLQEIHSLQNERVTAENISSLLSDKASTLFENLPSFIKKQFLLFPESDNAAQLSQIEMEKLLAHLVDLEMSKRMKEGTYKGKKFSGICHFFGFQTRGALPSQFDCNYAYALGHVCFYILAAGLSGYMAHITNLKNPVNKWKCGAIPITAMMTVNQEFQFPGATAVGKLALHPAKVDLKGKLYLKLKQKASGFLINDLYRNPGPIQFEGPGVDAKPYSLCEELMC
ncbi:hypothetical protein HPP92_003843 [Vanilla planifolia]|uniref:Pyrophosphate--fructose 6-phosphate 1-phosphotransferase subunit alpha n=1 Tax=Vanilla planifolia TaxID=51239 RepID=A0A835S7Z2_VANPL|nr:hypothetical protein HPP92_003843 [Vanilla planifolia]